MDYESVIGLEVHAQLATKSKIFCGCTTEFGGEPNTHGCPVCLGMPGVLPVLNRKVVDYALRMALAVGSEIQPRSRFLRKNYFYPDLPKGYQISQYQSETEPPLAIGGGIEIAVNGTEKTIRLRRIHMEEDAGKSVHDEAYVRENESLVDVNRCGVPLLEIVTEPDIRSPEEAYLYLTKLRQILIYLGICEGNMEEGNVRIDTNISVRPEGSSELGTLAEIKNMNSFRNVLRALEYERERQISLLEDGEHVAHETLQWDPERNVTSPMRSKEDSDDYRYFPEPDLVPVEVDQAWIEEVRTQIPELPEEKRARFVREYGLREYDAEVLATSRDVADYYERCVAEGADPRQASNWVMGDVLRELGERDIEIRAFRVEAGQLAAMIRLIEDGTISGKIAKAVFEEMANTGEDPKTIVEQKGLVQITDEGAISGVVEEILAEHPEEIERYRSGQKKLLGFFVGQVMRATKGKANPKTVNELLRQRLETGD